NAAAPGADATRLWSEASDERGASYMAEAKGGEQGAPGQPADHEEDPAQLGYAGVALGVMAAVSRDERATMILNVRDNGTVAGRPQAAGRLHGGPPGRRRRPRPHRRVTALAGPRAVPGGASRRDR